VKLAKERDSLATAKKLARNLAKVRPLLTF